MNRRKALFVTSLLGAFAPGQLLAQTKGAGGKTRKAAAPARRDDDEPAAAAVEGEPIDGDEPPADFPNEAGHQWRHFDIAQYTGLAHTQANPQTALIEWIFRRTESGPWHGDKIAVLCASRTQLRAYHNAKILRQVAEMVERFTKATADVLTVRVRFVAAADTRWRYYVNRALNPLRTGPQGQQIWALKHEDAAMVLAQMQVYNGFLLLADKRVEMINGQTLLVETIDVRNYRAGLQREGGVGLGYQPAIQQLKEGVTLRLSPLLSYDGESLDAAIELKADTIRSLHRTAVIAPKEIGPAEMTIDVPEVIESRVNLTVPNWTMGQTLLVSAGIQPGILQNKGGFLNLKIPGTVPTSTELLAFIDVEPAPGTSRRSSRAD